MNRVFIDLGFIKIYWYSALIFVALLLAGYMVIKESKRFKLNENKIYDYFFYMIPISIIGARLYYVLFNISSYNNIVEVLEVWNGGLAIHGGIIAGFIYTIFFCKKNNIELFRMTDIMCVPLLLGQAIGRWGNFFNQEAHGPITTYANLSKYIPFDFIVKGMKINGVYYQPTFLYESMWNILGFLILIVIRRLKNIKIGTLTGFYLIWYSIGRFFIEALRTDSLMLSNIKFAQLISIVLIILGTILILIENIKYKKLYNKGGK